MQEQAVAEHRPSASVQGLGATLAEVFALMHTRAPNADKLAANLNQAYDALLSIDFANQDMAAIKAEAPQLIQALFEERIKLRDEIAGWQAKGQFQRPAQAALRKVFRALRIASDMLGEILIDFDTLPTDGTTRTGFRGQDYNTVINGKFATGGDLAFKSGDVLLVRGRFANSAAIARIGDLDSQFSHVGVIYIDDTGRHWIVEALIEVGASVNPLSEALEHGLGRAVLFRHKDAELAARAAKLIHDHVRKRGSSILYNFSMSLENNYRHLFCSQLVRQAFDFASNGRVLLPMFGTRLTMKNRDFIKRIGVTGYDTFAPGDMELESDFDLVAEWRDYRVTSELRIQDLTMDKFFIWMDEHGYTFKETWAIRLISLLGRASSYLSKSAKELIEDIVPQVPSNMSRKAVATIAMLHKTATPVFDKLKKLEKIKIEKKGRPMHPQEIRSHLERIRAQSGGEIGYLT